MLRSFRVRAAAAVFAALGVISCSSPTEPSLLLRGGVLATFDVEGESFKAFVTNKAAIDELFKLRDGLSLATIPSGRIKRGEGRADHNSPYSWHLDSDDIEMASFTTEVCDGRPSYVQANVNEYVKVVRRYCPWGARLVDLKDYR